MMQMKFVMIITWVYGCQNVQKMYITYFEAFSFAFSLVLFNYSQFQIVCFYFIFTDKGNTVN